MKSYLGPLICILTLIISIRADPKCVSIEDSQLTDCLAAVRRWNELKTNVALKELIATAMCVADLLHKRQQ